MSTTTRTFETIAEAIAFRDGIEFVADPSVVARINDDDPWTIHVERADESPAATPADPFDQPAGAGTLNPKEVAYMAQKPEKTFRIGLCSASVFVNTGGKDGKTKREFRTVSLQRRYKDGPDWKSSSSFGLSDLPNAIAVMQMAMNHIAQHEADVTP